MLGWLYKMLSGLDKVSEMVEAPKQQAIGKVPADCGFIYKNDSLIKDSYTGTTRQDKVYVYPDTWV